MNEYTVSILFHYVKIRNGCLFNLFFVSSNHDDFERGNTDKFEITAAHLGGLSKLK